MKSCLVALVATTLSLVSFGARVIDNIPENLVDLTDDLSNRASITAEQGYAIGSPAKAFDNDHLNPKTNENYRFGGNAGVASGTFSVTLTYTFKEPRIVNAFRIFNSCNAHQYVERAPKAFQLRARDNDQEEWVVLDSETDQTEWGALEGRYFTFNNLRSYRQYSFLFTQSNGGAYITIQEAELFSHEVPTAISIEGSPLNVGTPDPVYGMYDLGTTGSATLRISPKQVTLDEANYLQVTGWKIYAFDPTHATYMDDPEEANSEAISFDASGVAEVEYIHPTPARQRRFVWCFNQFSKISVVANDPARGSINIAGIDAEGYASTDSTVTLTAQPASGYAFLKWQGDVEGIVDINSAQISFPGGKERSLTAMFILENARGEIYVSPEGDDANNGFSVDTPKKTIASAITYLNDNWLPDEKATIYLADGTHSVAVSDGLQLTSAITLTSLSGKKENVIVKNTITAGWRDGRCLYINHPQAVVSNITISSGQLYYGSHGACAFVDTLGGTITHCIVENGIDYSNKGRSAGVAMAAGVLSHTKIRTCTRQNNKAVDGLASALCLFGDSRANDVEISNIETLYDNVMIVGESASAINVTVVNCKVPDGKAVLDTSAYRSELYHGKFYNVVVANCTVISEPTRSAITREGKTENYFSCATDTDDDSGTLAGEGWKVATAGEMFKDPANGNWTPIQGSVLIDNGQSDGIILSEYDLLGKPRIAGKGVDIGCYEFQPRKGFLMIIR